jgi:CBS domain-containing protein
VLAREIMSTDVVTVSPTTSVQAARALLADRHISCLPVVEDEHVVGVVSETDLIRFSVAPDQRAHARTVVVANAWPPETVGQVMTVDPYVAHGNSDVADIALAFEVMTWKSVPVVDHGVLVGVVSRSDVLRELAAADRRSAPEVTP